MPSSLFRGRYVPRCDFYSSGRYQKLTLLFLQRGLILFGPPGNGKTISIKALMHSLSELKSPTVELLYVKTLVAFGGPERSIRSIFLKARAMAPCVLIFEDLDSLISDSVRSYFLNEVDGLESNHGIMMIGSTNHIERLDPGIAKRPSRFDRKYLFALPTRNERVQYCEYWRKKLASNKKVDFPEELCGMIADITKDFSFAYLKEAFVASLLTIVARKEKEGGGDQDGRDRAEKSLLWKEIQKQIKNLRDEMDNTANDVEKKKPIIAVPTQNPVVQMATTGASRVQF
jgi:transitional endoplasmic reticulum ATPase